MPNDFKVSVTFYDLGDQDGNVTGASVAAALLELSRSSAVGLIAGTKPPSATSQIAMFSTVRLCREAYDHTFQDIRASHLPWVLCLSFLCHLNFPSEATMWHSSLYAKRAPLELHSSVI